MKDPIHKRIEFLSRRLLINTLKCIVRRKNVLPHNLDFNTCKFLFIRQDRIGDVLISTPLFAAIKKYYPKAVIDVLLSKNNYFVLGNDPLIHRCWMYEKHIWKIIALVRTLKNEKYEFVIDLMDNPSATSTILCLFINAKWNIGIAKNNSFAYDITVPMLSRSETHIVDRISQLLTPFNIDPYKEKLAVRYFTSSQSEAFANNIILQNDLLSHPIIGVNISAGGNARFWGVDNFRQLLSYINETYPEYRSLLLYQPSDEQRARNIVESNPKVVLSPITSSFDQFAALVKRLSFLVTPDTAAVHLASAFKIGAVVLYVQSNKALRIWEPYGTDYESLITEVNDISTIPVVDVQEALHELIQRNSQIK